MNDPVKVRFPPSPTGLCHVGTARMALINFMFARKHGGQIMFRSEDTDKERSKPQFEQDILDSISWLGLSWDEFFRQSERTSFYTEALKRLIDENKAYISSEESKKEPGTTVEIVRLRNPGTSITFTDIVRGEITFDTTELGDFAIARAIDDPLYHLSVVVDDQAMAISHVIRGEEHISNTPRQILIQEALGYKRPQYAHYPLSLGTDRSKLSKRNGDVSVRSYRDRGFLAHALVNYLGMVGWTPPSGKEFLTLEEMTAEFALEDLHKSGAIFDIEKLRWYNRHYLLEMREDDFAEELLRRLKEALEGRTLTWNENVAHALTHTLRERISAWEDLENLVAEGELDFFFADPALEVALIPQKGTTTEDANRHLAAVHELLSELPNEKYTDPETVKACVWPYAEQEGRGTVLWPLRYSLSGRAKSPDPFTIAAALGKEETLRRISIARDVLQAHA